MKLLKQRKRRQTKQDNLSESISIQQTANVKSVTTTPRTVTNGYHLSAKTLPYNLWIEINVTGNFELLGNGPSNDLALAWASIVLEYAQLIKTPKSVNIFEAYKKIEYLEYKINRVEKLLGLLSDIYVVEAAESLVELGYDMVENLPKKKDYLRQLEMVERDALALIVMRNQAIGDYKALAPAESVKIDRSEMDYRKEVVILEKYVGRKIDIYTETLFDVAAIINAFIDEQTQKRKANG